MNQTFNFPRFWMLVTRHWAENRRRYLLSLLAIAGLLLAWNGFQFMMDKASPLRTGHQFVTYLVGLFLTGCIYASTIFSPLGNKKEATQYLSVPASQLEKFLCAVFYAVVLFFIFFTIVFYLVDIPMVKLSRSFVGYSYTTINGKPVSEHMGIVNVFSNEGSFAEGSDTPVFLLAFFAFQSAFILGSIYFNRYAFVKTVVALLLFAGISTFYIIKVVATHLPAGWHLNGLLEWGGYSKAGGSLSITTAAWVQETFTFLVSYCIPFVFYYIAYTRLKEKEV